MLSSGHRRSFAALGVVAMLLLALVPSVGRMLRAPDRHAHLAVAVAAPTGEASMAHGGMEGHHGHHSGHGASHPPAKPAPETPKVPHHGDCAYCPLAATMVFLAVPGLLDHATGPTKLVATAPMARRVREALVAGLGARGPPAFEP